MGRISGSDAQDAGTISRLSTSFSGDLRESSPPGSNHGDGVPAVDDFECEDPFEAFAEAIRQELAPRSRLERVLAGRVVLSAWSLHAAGVKELGSIRSSSPRGPAGTSPRDVFLVVRCLEKSLDLLRHLREDAQPRWGRPGSSGTKVTTSTTLPDTADAADEAPFDGDDLDPYGISNEWPAVPRGRTVAGEPDAEALPGESEETPALAERWHHRLVFDLNVSEHSPVVKGTWVTVSHVLSLIVDGWTWTDILRSHPELNVDDIRTCLAYTVAEGNGDT